MAFDLNHVVTLNYVSLYFERFDEAVAFYTQVFGAPGVVEEKLGFRGWKMGNTWLTVFPSRMGADSKRDACNAEFAVQVDTKAKVDELTDLLIQHGAKTVMPTEDTWMYENMRFSAVDDPFGVRIDVYCPIPSE